MSVIRSRSTGLLEACPTIERRCARCVLEDPEHHPWVPSLTCPVDDSGDQQIGNSRSSSRGSDPHGAEVSGFGINVVQAGSDPNREAGRVTLDLCPEQSC